SSSDSIGYFQISIDEDLEDSLFLKLEKEDYEIRILPVAELSDKDTIFIDKLFITEEIDVTGKIPFIQISDDKFIITPERSLIQSSPTLFDLFKKIPMISVDVDGNVLLKGQVPQFLMDGKKTEVGRFIKQFPAGTVK